MNNIGKHAQADSVYLGLRKVDGAIELLIKDNGNGFDPESLSSREISEKGLGLSSMRERVEFSAVLFPSKPSREKGRLSEPFGRCNYGEKSGNGRINNHAVQGSKILST